MIISDAWLEKHAELIIRPMVTSIIESIPDEVRYRITESIPDEVLYPYLERLEPFSIR